MPPQTPCPARVFGKDDGNGNPDSEVSGPCIAGKGNQALFALSTDEKLLAGGGKKVSVWRLYRLLAIARAGAKGLAISSTPRGLPQ